MTPHEKAVNAINARLEHLQARLREANAESATPFLFQSLVVTLGVAEALNDYIRSVGRFAERRHAELKQTNDTLAAQHTDLLNSGKALLEKFKANPADLALREEIERTQHAMTVIQKSLRRGANALQREVAPSLALIDAFAESVRRLCKADDHVGLMRVLQTIVSQVRDLYAAHPSLPASGILQAEAWEKAIGSEQALAAGFDDAYARAGYQANLALELMTLAVSDTPPQTAEDASLRANEAVAVRLKGITARFTSAP